MTASVSIAGRGDWLDDRHLQKLLAALSAEGELARIAGGAVRNALLGQAVADIDIATTTLPDETVRRVKAAGFKAVPTGIEHGTVTAVVDGRPFEVTTLRADVETDGRRAKVSFGRDWTADAERRDFTINGLYAEADGTVVDLVGGLPDIEARRLRFIGDAETRIREDYLRILRFFRFFAWYGDGRPDAEGLKACARLKDGLDRLSAEFTLRPDDEEERGSAPAERFIVDGGPARVGVIGSVTRPFCGACDRVRLTADGQVRNCLFATEESNLRDAMRGGATDTELADRWRKAVWAKRAGHGIDDPSFLQPARPMSAIGG